jgi:hypothetical protein
MGRLPNPSQKHINAKRPKDTIMSLGWGKLCMHGKFLNKKIFMQSTDKTSRTLNVSWQMVSNNAAIWS